MTLHSWNNSFVHGAAAYLSIAAGSVFGIGGLLLAGIISVYAGWCRQAYLASFLGGVIVAVLGCTAVGALSLPGNGFGVFFMVPFALLIILPATAAGYLVGRFIFTIAHRKPRAA